MSETLKTLTVATLAAVAVAGIGTLTGGAERPSPTAIVIDGTLPARAVELVAESKAVWFDGGIVYESPVILGDGGRDFVYRSPGRAPCMRRQRSTPAADCLLDGEPAPVLNRYPSARMTGVGCEPVACGVVFGEDADAQERPRGKP